MNGWHGSTRVEQLWWATVVVLLILFAVNVGTLVLDKRLIDGANVWAKPLKFEVSLALHFATLALIVHALNESARASAMLWWVAVAAVIATAFEVAYIVLQASRQEASHFNVATPPRFALYALMAVGAVVITVAAGVVGGLAISAAGAALGPATRVGIGVGLIAGTVLTLIVAFRMGGALSHHVGIEPAGAARMPLTGWSLTVGDRRVPHFFATHLMQVVPLAGLLLDAMLPPLYAVLGVSAAAIAWIVLTLVFFQLANSGAPFTFWA